MKQFLKTFGYWFIILLLWELSMQLSAYGSPARFLPGLLFTAGYAAVLTLLVSLPAWAGRVFGWILPPVLALIYGVQLVYFDIFGSFLSLAFVSAGGDAVTTFYTVVLGAMWNRLPQLLLLILPIVGYHVLRRFGLLSGEGLSWKYLLALGLVGCVLAGGTVLVCHRADGADGIDRWVERYGILTAEFVDLSHQNDPPAPPVLEVEPVEEVPVDEYANWNLLSGLDFAQLNAKTEDEALLTLNRYFASIPGTEKNEYTGLFAGYNLIVVCAEAFSNYVIDEELMPTLYRMSREGFVFNNFYNSFPNLTTNGEYSLCMGLMPDLSRMSFAVSVENYLPYAMGRISAANGMTSLAYHNNVGTFYNRINTHSNMGYDFRAVDHGLDMTAGSPSSDLEMMEKTMGDYLDKEPFHAYYMTYSGHSDYDFAKNEMSAKNQALVEKLPYSEEVKAYIACQLELEAAMTYLLEQLEAAGMADRTVVVLTGDHLPYGLSAEGYAELAGEEAAQEPFWQYKNSFLCWTGGMDEPVVVDDYCCTMDILPTVLNLMGFAYDSRLLTGRDVLADTTHMALLKDGSFLTEDLVYDANSDQLTWKTEEDPALAEELRQYASNQFTVSAAILNTNYYQFVYTNLDLSVQVEEEERVTYASYADIEGTWYEEAVELLTTYGGLSGGATGAFNGDRTASRADFVAMLVRSLGLMGSSDTSAFADIGREDWYYDILVAAAEAKLIPGSENFRPTEQITVNEASVILGRARHGTWLAEVVELAVAKQAEVGYDGAEGTLSRGAAAYLVAKLIDPTLPEPILAPVKPEEPPVEEEPVYVEPPMYKPEHMEPEYEAPVPEEPEYTEPEEYFEPLPDPLAPA